MLFLLKMKPENDSGNESMGPSHKEVGTKTLASSLETRTGNFSKSVTLWTPLQTNDFVAALG